jgi:hypothetical protein
MALFQWTRRMPQSLPVLQSGKEAAGMSLPLRLAHPAPRAES